MGINDGALIFGIHEIMEIKFDIDQIIHLKNDFRIYC